MAVDLGLVVSLRVKGPTTWQWRMDHLKEVSAEVLRHMLDVTRKELALKREILRLAKLDVEYTSANESKLVREGLRRDIRDGG